MVRQIKEQVMKDINAFTNTTRQIASKLLSLIISFWMIVGILTFGIMMPVYAMKIHWLKHANTSNETVNAIKQPRVNFNPTVNHTVYQKTQPDLRTDVQNITNALNEAKSLARTLHQLGSR